MPKEMIVSSSIHETKIAILEDAQAVEVFYEREKEYSLAGSIYKGRVTRILPGMQSAFVNIGLERDAFLYVSDFLEDLEDYDRVSTKSEDDATPSRSVAPEIPEAAAQAEAGAAEEVERPPVAEPPPQRGSERQGRGEPRERQESGQRSEPGQRQEAGHQKGDKSRRFSRRSRRHRPNRRGFPDSKYASRGPGEEPAPPVRAPEPVDEPVVERIVLPGESLAKYREKPPTASTSDRPESERRIESRADVREAPAGSRYAEESAAAFPATPAEPSSAAWRDSDISDKAAEAEASAHLDDMDDMGDVAATEASAPAGATSHASSQSTDDLEIPPMVFFDPDADEGVADVLEIDVFETDEDLLATDISAEPDALDAAEPEEQAMADHREEQFTPELSEPEFPDDDVDASSAEPQELSAAAEGSAASSGDDEAKSASPSNRRADDGGPKDAAVRQGSRNPRFQRRGRWQQRRGGDRGGEGQPQQPRPQQPPRKPRQSERESAPKPLIGDMLKEGQEIIVQVAKEPLGKKGARITSHVALPGRYLVYMPTLDHVGVSRKIASDEERHRLKKIILEHCKGFSGGFIARTAGEGHSSEDFRQDILFLVNLWADIKAKAEKAAAPALLHHDLDVVLRTLRDQFSSEFSAIWVDSEQKYEEIVSLVQKFQPALVNRVKLYTKDIPIFEETGVQDEINKALRPKVWLKSGGYIVINQTEALVAIDVNTGKFVGKSNRLEDTIVRTNMEAVQEIVRQIRLRDLGGIIVIDFIDMDERKNRQKVMNTLEEALKADRAPSKSLAFNEFGLVAITRKRVRQSLERTLCQPCSECTGSGLVKSPFTISLEILAEARKTEDDLKGKQLTLRVNPEVAKFLKARENAVVATIEEISGKGLIIRSDPALHIENYYFD